MSAENKARSVSRTTGVDRVRALQCVLYRCAKQDRDRRFHAQWHGAPDDRVCEAVNDVGEPCAGEPHARFEGGREVTRCRWPSRPKGLASLPPTRLAGDAVGNDIDAFAL